MHLTIVSFRDLELAPNDYDPTLGTFISPDTLVPDAGNVFDYNRFAYARLNPLKYTDPTGHDPQCEVGTSACDAEWTLWRQYLPYINELSWESFVAASRYYSNYASTPGMLLQDFLVSNGDISGDQSAVNQRLGYGEWYAQRVAGRPNLSSLFLESYETLANAQEDYAASNNQSAVLSIGLLMGAVFGGGDPPPYDRNAFGDWHPNVRQQVIARDGGKCVYCGSSEDLTVDHVVSLKQKWNEGAHAWAPSERNDWMNDSSNLVTACRSCNSQKRDMSPTDWIFGLFTGRYGR